MKYVEVVEFWGGEPSRPRNTKTVAVSDKLDNDQARRVAFRVINHQVEKDFNELAHNTMLIDVLVVPDEVAPVLLEMRG